MATYGTPQYPHWQSAREIDHVSAATTHLRAVFPEANLAPSSVEVTVLEALASMIGPLAMAFANAPSAVVERLMGLYGLYRYESVRAEGKAKFTASAGAARVELRAGTRLRYVPPGSGATLDFYTTDDLLIITSDSREGEVWIEAAEGGSHYNGLPVGTTLDAVDYILGVDAIELAPHTREVTDAQGATSTVTVGTAGGQNRETSASFNNRAMALLSRQRAALTYADQFEAAAVTRVGVGRAFALSNHNAATGQTATGHVTVAVTNTAGLFMDDEDMEGLQAALQADALASLVIHVRPAWYTEVNLAVGVEATADANLADVEAAVEDALRARLDPMSWSWWSTITALDIASWVDDVPGVARVTSAPATITLNGLAPLPLAGTITATATRATR